MKIVFRVMLMLLFTCSLLTASTSTDTKMVETTQGTTPQQELTDPSMKTFIEKIEIYGKVAKPQTVFIIPGTDPRVEGIQIERRFFGDIFRRVEKSTLRKEWIRDQKKRDHLLW
ncbi:hypothetical protein JXB12_11970 [candidate division KSB1 bacterium]|nr:hypothetical protein [candidate division KSB1 bacterium]